MIGCEVLRVDTMFLDDLTAVWAGQRIGKRAWAMGPLDCIDCQWYLGHDGEQGDLTYHGNIS